MMRCRAGEQKVADETPGQNQLDAVTGRLDKAGADSATQGAKG